jgi:uncharacterized membrane protein YdjX (TVP38/TMEM64 family)
MRLLLFVICLAVLILLPFLFWGDAFTQWFSGDAGTAWLRSWGAWSWLAVLVLLVGDLFLPVPATPVMSAAGYLFGFWFGGLLSATGSFLSGLLAYGLCRKFGRRAAARLAGEAELARGEAIFARRGAWLVALSRWLPLMPEVVSCLAGLARMPFGVFALALACGCLPMGFAYAAIGAAGHDRPGLALGLSAAVPVVLWLIVQRVFFRSGKRS